MFLSRYEFDNTKRVKEKSAVPQRVLMPGGSLGQ